MNSKVDVTVTGDGASTPKTEILDPKLASMIRSITRSRRRADYIDALTRYQHLLTRIPLAMRCEIDTAQAFRDAVREEIMLNGVRIVGDYRTEAFVAAVKRIVARHVDDPAKYLEVTDRIMRGCSRTVSGADSYFALHELFSSPHILIKPRQTQLEPLDVTLGRDFKDNRFKCRIRSVNLFGLYRQEDIDALLLTSKVTLEPFLEIDTLVVEVADLTTNKTQRHLTIQTPVTPSKLDLECEELF